MLHMSLMVDSCSPQRTDVLFPLVSQQAVHCKELTRGNCSDISWLFPAFIAEYLLKQRGFPLISEQNEANVISYISAAVVLICHSAGIS